MTERTVRLAIRSYGPADGAAVVELWNATIGERYPLRPDVLAICLERNPHYRPGDAVVALAEGRVVGFAMAGICRSAAPELAEKRGQAWLQAVLVAPAWWRRGIGGTLVRTVARIALEAGASHLSAGGGLFYLWPGIPVDLAGAEAFAAALGFELRGYTHDLRADVGGIRLDDAAAASLAGAGLRVVPAAAGDRSAVLDFLLAEFGSEWWHDIGWFLDAGGDPADLLLLRDAAGGIGGIARIHTARSDPPGWPMFWRGGAGGAGGAGGLGPIGVAASLRGRGLGRALLVAALDRLRGLGCPDVVVDDTSLLGYYAPHGFVPWITYRHADAPVGPLLAGTHDRTEEP
jgi:predicted N-acetyltransferase YhbS